MSKNLEELIYEETERRLDIMESKEYKFPKRIIISLVLIILCMSEVIK